MNEKHISIHDDFNKSLKSYRRKIDDVEKCYRSLDNVSERSVPCQHIGTITPFERYLLG